MKKNNLLQGAITALLIASPFVVNAGQYPAADFEPKVLYQDASVKSTPAVTVKAAPVITAVEPVAAPVADAKYPAANFEPKVLFKDDAYKPSKITSTSASEYKTSAGAMIMEQASTTKAEKAADEPNFLIFGLFALAALGFAASRCPKYAKYFAGTSDTAHDNALKETGVTRYLNARVPKISGVTKYLERAGKPTNVARYIAKQNIAQKAASAQNDANRG